MEETATETKSGEETLLAGDPHLHSTFSDGKLEPADLLVLGAAKCLDFLAVADHNTTAGAEAAREIWDRGRHGPYPLLAQEVSTEERLHLLVYGLQGTIGAVRFGEVAETLARVGECGGAAVLAHPWTFLDRPRARQLVRHLLTRGLIHGVELASAALFYEEFGRWRETLAWYQEECSPYRLAVLGGTDWHDHSQGFAIGLVRTLFIGRGPHDGDFVHAVRCGQTVAWLYKPLLLEHGLVARVNREIRGFWPEPWDGLLGSAAIVADFRARMAELDPVMECGETIRRLVGMLRESGSFVGARALLRGLDRHREDGS